MVAWQPSEHFQKTSVKDRNSYFTPPPRPGNLIWWGIIIYLLEYSRINDRALQALTSGWEATFIQMEEGFNDSSFANSLKPVCMCSNDGEKSGSPHPTYIHTCNLRTCAEPEAWPSLEDSLKWVRRPRCGARLWHWQAIWSWTKKEHLSQQLL